MAIDIFQVILFSILQVGGFKKDKDFNNIGSEIGFEPLQNRVTGSELV